MTSAWVSEVRENFAEIAGRGDVSERLQRRLG